MANAQGMSPLLVEPVTLAGTVGAKRVVTAGGIVPAADGNIALGITINGGTSGEEVEAVIAGIAVGVSNGEITKGALVMGDDEGYLVAATDGKYAIGVALDAATAADQDVRVLLGVSYLETT